MLRLDHARITTTSDSMDVPQEWNDRNAYALDGQDEDPDALNDETFGGDGWDDVDPVSPIIIVPSVHTINCIICGQLQAGDIADLSRMTLNHEGFISTSAANGISIGSNVEQSKEQIYESYPSLPSTDILGIPTSSGLLTPQMLQQHSSRTPGYCFL